MKRSWGYDLDQALVEMPKSTCEELMEGYRKAIRDFTAAHGDLPTFDLRVQGRHRATLEVYGKDRDGSVRAAVRIETPFGGPGYLRRLRAGVDPQKRSGPIVHLRQTR